MKRVILMRHAKAESESARHSDFERQLTDSGIQMAGESAQQLLELHIPITRILTSSAERTLQTAQVVQEIANCTNSIVSLDELYHAHAGDYARAIHLYCQPDDESVLVVGHNPGIAELMMAWAQLNVAVPPSTVAVFEADIDDWSAIAGPVRPAMTLALLIRGGIVCSN